MNSIKGQYAVRGAITLDANTSEQVEIRSRELIAAIVCENNLGRDGCKIVSVIISSTADITAAYPAAAIRKATCPSAGKEIDFSDIPLFSCLEPAIDGALKLCVRVLVTVSDYKRQEEFVNHIYLRGAEILRRDLKRK